MKKMLLLLLICAIIFASACAPAMQAEPSQAEEAQLSSSNEEFEITLYTDKGIYVQDEAIECYAELKYLGSDAITVYSGNPLLGFGVKDEKYFDGGYVTNDSLEYTQFAPGETVRVAFSKSGGDTSDDPLGEVFKEYYADSEFVLPSGEYEISANIDYSLDVDDMLGSRRTLSVSVTVTVE